MQPTLPSNQVERIISVTIAQRELAQLEDDLQFSNKYRRVAQKMLDDKKSTLQERAAAQIAVDNLKPFIGKTKARIAEVSRYINDLDHQAADNAMVRIITGSLYTAEIVITYTRDNGKKISYTRHVERGSLLGKWFGRSTLTKSLVVYRMPGESAEAEAA